MTTKKFVAGIAGLLAAAALALAGIVGGPPMVIGVFLLLTPALLAIRQLVWPVAEPQASWVRALLAPGLMGLGAGLLGGLIYREVESCPLECLGDEIFAALLVPPALAVVAMVVLWQSRTPRPWLTGLLGLMAALNVAYCLARITFSYVAISVAAGIIGFLWAALVLGPRLPPMARLVVYVTLFAIVAAAFTVQPVSSSHRREALRLETITVPLVAPDVPGFAIVSATGDKLANELSVTLGPFGARPFLSMADEIRITGLALPSGFDPPESCGPAHRWMNISLPCTYAGPDLWRRMYLSNVQFLRRVDNWLYIVEGGTRVDENLVRRAATSLHPVTARELASGNR